MVKTYKRLAFTLIELIFAIVIIGIAVVSLPVMAKITEKGIESNILQEAIFASSAQLMGISSGYWDARSVEDIAYSHMSRVIDINSSCDSNKSNPRYRLRVGHIAQPLHRRCVDDTNVSISATAGIDTLASAVNALDGTLAFEDLNDATVTGERTGYKDDYMTDVNITTTGNIKIITITIKNDDGPITRLSMQSANIGEIDYYKRRF